MSTGTLPPSACLPPPKASRIVRPGTPSTRPTHHTPPHPTHTPHPPPQTANRQSGRTTRLTAHTTTHRKGQVWSYDQTCPRLRTLRTHHPPQSAHLVVRQDLPAHT